MDDTLIERLEAASGPDRGLDAEIHWLIKDGVGVGYAQNAPAYTASLDAAMGLVPEGCVTYLASEDRHSRRWEWSLRDKLAHRHHARANTGPLALCIAALRAQAGEKS